MKLPHFRLEGQHTLGYPNITDKVKAVSKKERSECLKRTKERLETAKKCKNGSIPIIYDI